MLASGNLTQVASLWSNPSFRSLSLLPQNLFQFLLTGRFRLALPGLIHIMGGTATLSGVMSHTQADVTDAVTQLGTRGLVEWDPDTELMLIAGAERYEENHCKNPNTLRAWWATWERLPDCELKTALLVTVRRSFPGLTRMPSAWDLWGNTFAPPLESYLIELGVPAPDIRAFVGPTSRQVVKSGSRPPPGLAPSGSLAPRSAAMGTAYDLCVVPGFENASGGVRSDGRSRRSAFGAVQRFHQKKAPALVRAECSQTGSPDTKRGRIVSLSVSPIRI